MNVWPLRAYIESGSWFVEKIFIGFCCPPAAVPHPSLSSIALLSYTFSRRSADPVQALLTATLPQGSKLLVKAESAGINSTTT